MSYGVGLWASQIWEKAVKGGQGQKNIGVVHSKWHALPGFTAHESVHSPLVGTTKDYLPFSVKIKLSPAVEVADWPA